MKKNELSRTLKRFNRREEKNISDAISNRGYKNQKKGQVQNTTNQEEKLQKKKSACSFKNVNSVSEFRSSMKKEAISFVLFAIDASLKDQPLGLSLISKVH